MELVFLVDSGLCLLAAVMMIVLELYFELFGHCSAGLVSPLVSEA